MTTSRLFHVGLLALSMTASAACAQPMPPLIFRVTAWLDGQSETQRLTMPAAPSATGQHITLLAHTHTYDVGGSMPRAEWEKRFAAGLPDSTIPLGCDTTACQFIRHRWAKTGIDVTLRPVSASGTFQALSIGVTLHRFRPSSDAQVPSQVDTWTHNIDTSLRMGDSRTLDLDGQGTVTIERLATP